MATDHKLIPSGSRAVKGGYRAVVDNDGNRTTVSWAYWPKDMPRSAIGRKVTFTYCSRAGDPTAEMQRHSISATVRDAV